MAEKILMKGNEAIAYAAINCGCDGYFGYTHYPPVGGYGDADARKTLGDYRYGSTPRLESETSSINMVYGGASCSKKGYDLIQQPRHQPHCEGLAIWQAANFPVW